ncbi:methionine biosynthesis protein MetW [Dokdonella sp.]|uniref:methionine biosynthesis protein MetW n=1 Tax=Dokdonella sp. TaxID=2291710 RepID=UPI003784DF8F
MQVEPQRDFLERVKTEILAEAARLRASTPLPRVDPPADETTFAAPVIDGIERQRLDYAIEELTGSDYVAFVEQAFRAVLKRPSDEGGREQQVQLLAQGAAKAEVLGNLRWSPEGRRIGVRVRGLLPRYALAKLGRVRGVGFLVQWALAFAALPLLLRHQRAADTQAAARHGSLLARIDERDGGVQHELARLRAQLDPVLAAHGAAIATHAAALAARDESRRELEQRLQAQQGEHARLVDATLQATSARLDGMQHREDGLGERIRLIDTALQATHARFEDMQRREDARLGDMQRRDEGLAAEIAELRQYVHAMNHWTTTLQRSLDELEQVAQDARGETDALYAAIAAEGATARAASNATAAAAFARDLTHGARVLDLGSGDGSWLRALAALGLAGNGVEPNATLAQRARDAGADVATGDAFALLGRAADASLDGLALDAGLLAHDEFAVLEFSRHAPRVLKPRAPLLLRFDLPARGATVAPLADRLVRARALLAASGFAAVETLDGTGAPGLLARRGEG